MARTGAYPLERKPQQLSGGERQRVALSRAMVRDAELYLYDEPLSNLDAQLRHQAREDILTLHREKRKPTVYVTHDQSEAMALGDRIAVMQAGRIQQIGTELYEQLVSEFVAYFIGTPSMNLFDVVLREDSGQLVAEHDGLTLVIVPRMSAVASAQLGRVVRLGIRPEHLHVPRMATFPVSDENTIRGVVTLIEPTSSGSTVYLTITDRSETDFVATFNVRVPASYLDQENPVGR
ncbi:ABC transporter ATP-binding protein [Tenggerimyces flavus]|uniref:ABC transporter ATP-binding protein n=1 Tax=Tenggerimyces flavus TaxID=1708749 RepID=A0ABV7YRK1_9ACTN|nr:ATP-binding cassette domain-containing protein [Tenggerimyces flavus]MBM7790121.1 ABC-type sugar transport system ATPase subunit [Tenggerimyces flavus]